MIPLAGKEVELCQPRKPSYFKKKKIKEKNADDKEY